MKKVYIFRMLMFALALMGGSIQAQVIEACAGADSVKLRLDNFLYGSVQWQQSDDNIEWEDIDYATDTVYVFKPEKTRYYRATVYYESCPFDTSQVTLVRVTAQADAGPDKIVQTGLPTFLYGNMEDDAWGEWMFLEGTGGVLSDSTDNMPVFTGTDTLYRLIWTLSNVCGSTSDTVEVKYIESEYYDAIVVVDTTDLIVGDTSEMEVGLYKIVFNTPVPNITDTTVLIGINHDGGFLRKVYYHEYHGDTCWMVTSPATVDDILISGVINIEDYAEMSRRRALDQGKIICLNHIPTRSEMLNDSLFNSHSVYYYLPNSNNRGLLSWTISFPHSGPINISAGISLDDIRGSFSPHFDIRIVKKYFFSFFEIGLFNTRSDIELDFSFSGSANYEGVFDVMTYTLTPIVIFSPIPIYIGQRVKIPIHITASPSVELSDAISLTIGNHSTFNAFISLPNIIPGIPSTIPGLIFPKVKFIESNNVFDFHFDNIDLYFRLSINPGLEYHFLPYEFLDNYINMGFKVSGDLCVNPFASHKEWEGRGLIYPVIQFGSNFKDIIHNTSKKLWKHEINLDFLTGKFSIPSKMTILSGNYQLYLTTPSTLSQPLRVKITTIGIPMPLTPVYFEPTDGSSVSNNLVHANLFGEAETFWNPANSSSEVKASIYGCNQKILRQVTFKTVRANCQNSTLNLSKKKLNGNQWTVYATGGHPPYTFYLDGVSHNNTPPVITPEPGVSHNFGVVDASLCTASANLKIESDFCNNSNLSLNYTISNIENFANPVLFLYAEGGAPPYTYLLDGDPNSAAFQPDHTYYGLAPGQHTAYVKDSLGCVRQCSFPVENVPPKEVIVVTMNADNVTDHTAKAHATLYTEDPSYVLHRGVCWDTHDNPTVLHSKLDYTTACQQCVYDYNITGLSTNTTYFVRAYAVTPYDTIYGNSTHFRTTAPYLPNVTANVSNISYTTARISGEVLSDGGSPVTARGICWGTTLNPSAGTVNTINCGSGLGEFSYTLTNLVPGTYYYIRTFATNSSGTAYSDSLGFYPLNPSAPDVETDSVYDVTASSATASGRVIDFNSDSQISRGFCWSLEYGPTARDNVLVCGSDTGHFVGTITGLLPDTIYFLRAFAINNVDTGYGAIITFQTDTMAPDTLTPDTTVTYGQPCDPPTLTDYDGNVYHAVQIGSQCWMQENLRTTHFANGNPIAMGHTGSSTSDAYRYAPENDMNKVPLYGYLYNWPALVNGSSGSSSNPSGLQGVCPNGWHVPSNAEWNDLANFLDTNYPCGGDGQNIAKAMASTTTDWYTNNSNSCAVGNNTSLNNASGFTALPAGFFAGGSMPSETGPNAYFATSTAGSSFLSYFVTVRYITYSQSTLQSNQELKSSAFSVRCVRN